MSNELKIELLWNCAKALKGEQQTHKLLKSYYINTCRKLAKNNLQIPKEKFALSQMCPHCGSFWNESEFELKLIPKHLKLTSKERKLIESYKKNDGSVKLLNKAQKNRAKWLMKRQFTRMAVKCKQCKHKSFINMENERNKSLEQPPQNEKYEIVLEKHNYQQTTFNQKGGCSEPLLQSKSKKKKQNTSICKEKTKEKNPSNKVVSNTQKQNSLLQLAALLKKQTTADTKHSTQKKLQTLLK